MKKILLSLALFILFIVTAFSQNIGINTTGTNPSINAILDLNSGNSNNLGLIIPNVSLTTLGTFKPPIANAATAGDVGMIIYNTNAAVGSGIGYYYWNGVNWTVVSPTLNNFTVSFTLGGAFGTGPVGTGWYITGQTLSFTVPAIGTYTERLEIEGTAYTQSAVLNGYTEMSIGIYVDGSILEPGYYTVQCNNNPANESGRAGFNVEWTGNLTAGIHTMQILFSANGGTSPGVVGPWITQGGITAQTTYFATVTRVSW